MDRNRQSELMSAYLDGELTPAERAEAERLLETSPELRDELNDFARLSDLLRALPRESAPAEMASAIKKEAERKSLLGPEPSVPRRSWLREAVVAVSAMAATALGMLLLPKDAWEPASQLASRSAPVSEPAATSRPDAPLDAAAAEADFSAEISPAKTKPETLAMRAAAPAPPPAPVHDAEIAANIADGLALNGTEHGQDAVRIGDVVPYFQNGVGVVVLTVVDVESAGDKVAVLLANNGLSVPPELTTKQAKERAADEKPATGLTRKFDRDQQLMVYLHASRETIAQVLDEMVQEQLFSQVQLQPPVEAPEIASFENAPAESQVAAADKQAVDGTLAEQVLASNAAVVGQNFQSRQRWAEDLARDGARRKASAKDGEADDRRKVESQKKAQAAGKRNRANSLAEDLPADAFLAENTLAGAVLQQNYAAVMKLDAVTGDVLNNTVMLEQRKLAEAKRVRVAESPKSSVQLEKAADRAEDEHEGLSEEIAAERTVRLLLVLQAPAAKTP